MYGMYLLSEIPKSIHLGISMDKIQSIIQYKTIHLNIKNILTFIINT